MDLHSLRIGELINDAIISSFAKIVFASSPYWDRRRFVPPCLSKQIELQPERYGNREAVFRGTSLVDAVAIGGGDCDGGGGGESNDGGTSDDGAASASASPSSAAPWLPTDESEIVLVPYNLSLHWTMAVLVSAAGGRGRQQQQQLRLHQNSLDGGDFGHVDSLQSVLRRCELIPSDGGLVRYPGPRQKDGYNCGAAICLSLYVWLMHPDPLEFDWDMLQRISPYILDEFRDYILYTVCTGEVSNIFDAEDGAVVGRSAEDAVSVPTAAAVEDRQSRDDDDDEDRMSIDGEEDDEEGMESVSVSSAMRVDEEGDDDDDTASSSIPVWRESSAKRDVQEEEERPSPHLWFANNAERSSRDVFGDDPFGGVFGARRTRRLFEDAFDAFGDPFDMSFSRRRRDERGMFPLIL